MLRLRSQQRVGGGTVEALVSPSRPQRCRARERSPRSSDTPAIEQLLAGANLPLAGLADALPAMVVADAEGAIVGTAALEVRGENALLRSVAVAPEWRS